MQIRYNYFIKQLFSAKCFLEQFAEIPIKQNPASRILRLRLVASSDIQRVFEKGFPLQCEAGNCEGTGQLPLLNI